MHSPEWDCQKVCSLYWGLFWGFAGPARGKLLPAQTPAACRKCRLIPGKLQRISDQLDVSRIRWRALAATAPVTEATQRFREYIAQSDTKISSKLPATLGKLKGNCRLQC